MFTAEGDGLEDRLICWLNRVSSGFVSAELMTDSNAKKAECTFVSLLVGSLWKSVSVRGFWPAPLSIVDGMFR